MLFPCWLGKPVPEGPYPNVNDAASARQVGTCTLRYNDLDFFDKMVSHL